jgi:hypothetical protein
VGRDDGRPEWVQSNYLPEREWLLSNNRISRENNDEKISMA